MGDSGWAPWGGGGETPAVVTIHPHPIRVPLPLRGFPSTGLDSPPPVPGPAAAAQVCTDLFFAFDMNDMLHSCYASLVPDALRSPALAAGLLQDARLLPRIVECNARAPASGLTGHLTLLSNAILEAAAAAPAVAEAVAVAEGWPAYVAGDLERRNKTDRFLLGGQQLAMLMSQVEKGDITKFDDSEVAVATGPAPAAGPAELLPPATFTMSDDFKDEYNSGSDDEFGPGESSPVRVRVCARAARGAAGAHILRLVEGRGGGGGGGRTMPHSAQSQHANYWAPRTRKRHQQEHRPQRPTESSDPMQHAKGRTGDRPGPRKGATTRRNVTWGGGGGAPRGCMCGGNRTPPPPPDPLDPRRWSWEQQSVRTHSGARQRCGSLGAFAAGSTWSDKAAALTLLSRPILAEGSLASQGATSSASGRRLY